MKKIIIIALLAVAVISTSSCGMILDRSYSKAELERELPSIKSYEDLLDKLKGIGDRQAIMLERSSIVTDSSVPAQGGQEAAMRSSTSGSDFSGTNLQVQGVDEADIVKTDGRYIYQVNGNQVIIIQAYPASQMRIVGRITFNEEGFFPTQLYLDSKYLIVIGDSHYYIMPNSDTQSSNIVDSSPLPAAPDDSNPSTSDFRDRFRPFIRHRQTVKVLVYNIENPENVTLERSIETEGYYVSSRKIGAHLYIVSNKHINFFGETPGKEEILPWYRDSRKGENFLAVEYSNIRVFPDGTESSYLILTGLDLSNIQNELMIDAYLGSGQIIYASLHNLYVAVMKWEYVSLPEESIQEPSTDMFRPVGITHASTQIYRFRLNRGRASFVAKGEVPGILLNQFSMDEHDGYFRVATTTGDMWRDDEFTSKNNLFVLNAALEVVGRIENIAPGERIYSVRFMGDRGYMVTFRTVDPLFVLDLKNPRNPSILGELKIPGYSDYLHPFDENHLIGFGMDVMEANIVDPQGNVVGTTIYQMGMKVAMFDVSDVSNPREKFNLSIGGRGTYSEILHNHKALVFSKERNLMAFPVMVVQSRTGNPLDYGAVEFQGMHVYQVDTTNGFVLQAAITHLSQQELRDAKEWWFDYMKAVERGLYINDVFYTLSRSTIKAHEMPSFIELGTLSLN